MNSEQAVEEQYPGLQIDEDIAFEKKEWTVQRVGWVLLLGLLLLATAGLFGHGPISWTTTSSENGTLTVSYERFGRGGGRQTLVVQADASIASGGEWKLLFADGYVGAVEFNTISPEPNSAELVANGVEYSFGQTEPDADLEVTFFITPHRLWGVDGQMKLGGESVNVEQFFFP